MTTDKMDSMNFITGDLDEPAEVSDFDQEFIDILEKPSNNSVIEHANPSHELAVEINGSSELANQNLDMLNDCMALNRIRIQSIQTISPVNYNSGCQSYQSLLSSTSASSVLTTSSDDSLLQEESKDEVKFNMKTEKKVFENEDKDASTENLDSDSHGKELFTVVLDDDNGMAVIQVGDPDDEKTDVENDDLDNLFEPDDSKLFVKTGPRLKASEPSSVEVKKHKDPLWAPPSSIVKSEKRLQKNRGLKSRVLSKSSCNCKECDREFDYSSAINLRIKTSNGERFYKCPRCNFASFYLTNIKNHIRLHTGLKPFKCYTCQKKFLTSQTLLKHKYECHLLALGKTNSLRCKFCKEPFGDNQALKVHLASHKVGDFFVCSICKYQKKSPSSLETHMNKHANNELFFCDECGKSFQQKGLLKEHWLFYHVSLLCKKMYKCPMCPFNFVHFECLCRHTKKAHRKQLKSNGRRG